MMDDLIRRSDALEALGDCPDNWCDTLEEIQAVADWRIHTDAIKGVKAVDAVPVAHGRWVKMTGMMPPEYHGHYECSECGWHMKGLRNSWTREEEMTYCPNCGAKMDGERRENDA